MRTKFVIGLILLLVGFLGGFIPQYRKGRDTAEQLSTQGRELSTCRLSQQLSNVRDSAAMAYLQATQKNYGIATEYSKRLFDEAQKTASSTDDPGVRKLLGDVLAAREPIMADLANGDAAVISKLQPLLANLEQNAKP
jgi:hypothetical protein